MLLNDSWIAATAIANDLPAASQDGDCDDVPGLRVLGSEIGSESSVRDTASRDYSSP